MKPINENAAERGSMVEVSLVQAIPVEQDLGYSLSTHCYHAAVVLLVLSILRFPFLEGLLGVIGAGAVLCSEGNIRERVRPAKVLRVTSAFVAGFTMLTIIGSVVVGSRLIPYSGTKAVDLCLENAEHALSQRILPQHGHTTFAEHNPAMVGRHAIGGTRFDALLMMEMQQADAQPDELDQLVELGRQEPVSDLFSHGARTGRALNMATNEMIGTAVHMTDRVMPTTPHEPTHRRCTHLGRAVRITGAVCMLFFMLLEILLALAAVYAHQAASRLLAFAQTAGVNAI